MENLIEGRVILGLVCLVHLFANYAVGISWGHIKKRTLNGFIIAELIAVTAYIIYDNLQTPPHDGWGLAIVGYALVYALILMTWLGYSIYTELDDNKTYEMTIKEHIRLMNKDFFRGTVMNGKKEVEVLLPYSEELVPSDENSKKKNVRFAEVFRAGYILVKVAS